MEIGVSCKISKSSVLVCGKWKIIISILCVEHTIAEYGVHCAPIIVIRRTEEINPVHWLGAEEQTGHTHLSFLLVIITKTMPPCACVCV